MTKRFAALSLSLLLCSAAAIAFIAPTASAQAPDPHNPVLLAQATPPAAARGGSGRALNRPAPSAADRTARRGEFCQEGYARAAGRFAALEVRLNLTAAQTGAFNRWRDLRLAAAKRTAGECTAQPQGAPGRGPRGGTATPPSPVERLTREETRLQHRLADIQAERPGLEALYNSLSPAQRQTLARERGGFGRGPGMHGMGMRGMMGRGPGGEGNRMFRRSGPQGPGMMGPGPQGGPGGRRGPGMNPPPGDQPPPPPQ